MAELYKSVTELMKTARGNKALQGNLGDITDFQQIIDDTPTADVEEVVRCMNCKNYHKYLTIGGFFRCECVFDEECITLVHEMHFCSYGERKDA